MYNPLIILGCPRSGTTMLSGLLKNTKYGEPFETHFITKYYKKLESYGSLENKSNFKRLVTHILNERPVMQMHLDINMDEFYAETVPDYGKIVSRLCMMKSGRKGCSSWGDKTPHYLLDLDIIYKLFPDSKYIYIVRDGRDVALSLMTKPWGQNNIYACADYWKRCNAQNGIFDELKKKGLLYSLRYEDLLADSEKIVPDIYSFLGEVYDDGLMRNLIGRVRKDNFNNWKKKMNSSQIELFERVASDTLRRFGYETRYEETGVGKLNEIYYNFHEAASKGLYLLKTNTLDTIRIKYFGKQPFHE